MPDQKDAQELMRDWTDMKSRRQRNWDGLYQEVKDVVWPNSEDFTVTRQPGTYLVELVYDSTAPWANGQFANGMHAAVANPFEDWFTIKGEDDEINNDPECARWLQKTSRIIMDCYLHPQANHKQSLHSYFLSLGCLGTGNVCQEWDEDINSPCFSAVPLTNYWITLDDKGRINKCFRLVQWTKRQAISRFGEENIPPKLRDTKVALDGEKYDFIHCVQPRRDRDPSSLGSLDMPFRSQWLYIGGALVGGGGGSPAASETPFVCAEGGYRTFPYHVGRWEVIEGQEYGRSPAMTALPDIKDLNQMKKIALKAGQKMVDPPIIAPNDAFMNQFDQTPGAVNYYDSSNGLPPDACRPFLSGGNLDNAEKLMAPEIMSIERIFYTDLGNIPFKKERQTTAEINAQQDSILRNVAPLVGRQEAEVLGPMIMRTYDLCSMWGKLTPHPVKMAGRKLKIVYVSRAARAIKGSRLAAIRSYVAETVVPMAQVAPEVKDFLNCDAVVMESAKLADITLDIFRTPDQVAAIRKDRAAQQAQQQQLAAAESASTSLKNVGQAAQASPELVGAGQPGA